MKSLYSNRKLTEGYPDLEKLGTEYFSHLQTPQPYTLEIMKCVEGLVDLKQGPRTVLIVGCGPNPHSIKELLQLGYEASGVEPIESYVHLARESLGGFQYIHLGSAEALPIDDNSQRIVLLENVLEHVDSPDKSLSEAYRVLLPGGILYIYTTNRWRFSLTGRNDEFRTRFYNWFPDIIKESYVFHHLHYDPSLANYTPRPAVHWFSYPDLCKLGRRVGFSQFYSLLDLVDANSPFVAKSKLRRWLLNRLRHTPWLRGLALSQVGSSIFMLKRPC